MVAKQRSRLKVLSSEIRDDAPRRIYSEPRLGHSRSYESVSSACLHRTHNEVQRVEGAGITPVKSRCVPREYSIVRTGSGTMGTVPRSLAWLYAERYWNQAGKGEKPRPPATSAYDSKPRR
jgi:hypothetical protein